MKASFVFGTRPEIIKMAPVVNRARFCGIDVQLIHTGQHRELANDLLKLFSMNDCEDLRTMQTNSSLSGLSQRIITEMNAKISPRSVDCVIVQGDTTSAFIGAYWAFCNRVPLAHIEAGLRSGDLKSPYPEEANRRLIGQLANLHFTPTSGATETLVREGVSLSQIAQVGNTAIDALLLALEHLRKVPTGSDSDDLAEIQKFYQGKPMALVTCHRRENHGEPLFRICQALLAILKRHPELHIVFPVHPNPNVRAVVYEFLSNHPRVRLCDPRDYISFVQLMRDSSVIITDSGGVQEEAPTLRKPIVVVREETERPEGVQAGFARLCGTKIDAIVDAVDEALRQGCLADGPNPFGDGRAAERIVLELEKRFETNSSGIDFEVPVVGHA